MKSLLIAGLLTATSLIYAQTFTCHQREGREGIEEEAAGVLSLEGKKALFLTDADIIQEFLFVKKTTSRTGSWLKYEARNNDITVRLTIESEGRPRKAFISAEEVDGSIIMTLPLKCL